MGISTKVPNFAKKITFFATIRDVSPFGTAFHDIIGEFLSALEPRVGARRSPNCQNKDKMLLKFRPISLSFKVSTTLYKGKGLFLLRNVFVASIGFHLRPWLHIQQLILSI